MAALVIAFLAGVALWFILGRRWPPKYPGPIDGRQLLAAYYEEAKRRGVEL